MHQPQPVADLDGLRVKAAALATAHTSQAYRAHLNFMRIVVRLELSTEGITEPAD